MRVYSSEDLAVDARGVIYLARQIAEAGEWLDAEGRERPSPGFIRDHKLIGCVVKMQDLCRRIHDELVLWSATHSEEVNDG